MGLSLVLVANVNDYSVTNGKFDGFKVTSNSLNAFSQLFNFRIRYWLTLAKDFQMLPTEGLC